MKSKDKIRSNLKLNKILYFKIAMILCTINFMKIKFLEYVIRYIYCLDR